MEKLRVKFVDFWKDMDRREGNFFFELLSEKYQVEFSDDPQVVFYSCYGKEYLKYACTRIFFSPENWRPDFSECDYAITFDHLEDERHLRMPLWALYCKKDSFREDDPELRYAEWANRKNFCCMIVSNANAPERIEFYTRLNSKLKVDSAGKWNNTIGRDLLPGTENKLEFIRNYRFVISFENASYPGYTTEKIIEPLMEGCIPIYWGDPEVHLDFNPQRFINVRNAADYDEVINRIIDLENNKDKAKALLKTPIFRDNKLPVYLEEDYMDNRLFSWIDRAKVKKFKGVGGQIKGRMRYYSTFFKSGLRAFKNKLAQ